MSDIVNMMRMQRPTAVPPPVPLEGRIVDVVGPDVFFVVDDWDALRRFGPAPWNKASVLPPTVGDSCLVVFVGVGIEKPRVVAWY